MKRKTGIREKVDLGIEIVLFFSFYFFLFEHELVMSLTSFALVFFWAGGPCMSIIFPGLSSSFRGFVLDRRSVSIDMIVRH